MTSVKVSLNKKRYLPAAAVFNEVAKHLSFSKAAEVLHLTPPAVTMQIKEWEGHVGLPLFDRGGPKISLTTTGE